MWDNTPLSYAAAGGHEEVVKILLGREEVNPGKPNNILKTPLSHAARGGHGGVVKILLRREDVNPDKPCDMCLKYGYGAQSLLLYGEYCASTRGLRCTLSEEELCSMRADW